MSRRKHHFVPVAYLRHFTNSRENLNQYSLKTKQIEWVHPNNTCFQYAFYDLTADLMARYKSTDKEYLETRAFKKYEENIGPLNEKLERHHSPLLRSEFDILVIGYLQQKHRTPYYRKLINTYDREQAADVQVNFVRNAYAQRGIIAEPWLAELRQRLITENPPEKIHLSGMVESSQGRNDATADAFRILLRFDIDIFEAPQGEFFLTSDNPGFSVAKMKDGSTRIFNTNYGNFECVYFPINSKQVIFFTRPANLNVLHITKDITYRIGGVETVRTINMATASVADEKIFCADRDFLKQFVDILMPPEL